MIISKRVSISMVLLLGLSVVVNAGTIVHWHFEGTIGQEITSDTDSANSVTVNKFVESGSSGTVTYGLPNPFYNPSGTSAEFTNTASDAYGAALFALDPGTDSVIDLTTPDCVTIEAFVYPYDVRQGVIIRKGFANVPGRYFINISDDGVFQFAFNAGGFDLNLYANDIPYVTNQWQHVALVWDGSYLKFYVDGVQAQDIRANTGETFTAQVPVSGSLPDNGDNLSIGALLRDNLNPPVDTGQFFHGRIDELRISDTALPPEQFLNAYTTPIIQFQLSESQNTENITTADLAVVLSNSSPNSVTVDYCVTSGTADGNGIDYTLAAGTLTFAPLQATPEYITIDINDDDLPESDETIVVTLSNATEADLGYKTEHTYTIIDDDTIPTVEFASTASAGSETLSPVYLTVNLSHPYKDTVSVCYAAVGGSADWGIDYILPNGLLTFDPYEISQDITLEIVDDGLPDNGEDIEVLLFFPTNAVLGTNQDHWYTIYDGAFVNSLDMEFVLVQPGTFQMGSENSIFDEIPVRDVTISQPYYMAVTEVTNAQYEQFDPNHNLIDHRGFNCDPDEAVIFVSWNDANAFCTWLSEQEGLPYRLPTEAEWEYACRAGTTTKYYTGDTLPSEYLKNQSKTWGPVPQDLTVGQTPPNPWGLYDMHGNVEEWCNDWYELYDANDIIDPVGRAGGKFRVTRGGSHSTVVDYLRSANRLGTIPIDNHWLIGFRVVMADMPDTEPLPEAEPQEFQQNVSQTVPEEIYDRPDPTTPYFYGPRKYVWIPDGSVGPLWSQHNHVPAVVECPNGDLLVSWLTQTSDETGREKNVAITRLPFGQDQWQDASVFWEPPDRNTSTDAMWVDEAGKLYHFNGLSEGAARGALAVIIRTSVDNGVTWTKAEFAMPERSMNHTLAETIFRTSWGSVVLPADVGDGTTPSHMWLSDDNGQTWYDPGGGLQGIHNCIAELNNGDLLAFGRNDNINNMMPQNISTDRGVTWQSSASVFPPIGGGQRAVLLRLQQGPLFFASFSSSDNLFGSVSYDDGASWTAQRLITDDGPGRLVETLNGVLFTMSATESEPKGYLTVHQTKNGLIHLLSSRQHYVFNIKYIDSGYEPPIVDYDDLEAFSRDWLDSDKLITASLPDDSNLVLDYSFDGTLNEPVPTGLTDDTGTYTAQIIVGTNPASEIKYASPNPTTGSGTSAQFINDLFGTGDADTFVIPNSGGLEFSDFNEFSIELFVNPSSSGSGNTRRLFSESIYMYVHLDIGNALNASRKWGPGDWDENWTNLQDANFPHDTWSHVATTWDADSEDDRFKLYINGELVASDVGSSDLTLGTAAGFAIGGYQREALTTTQPFCGSIDQFSIYDYALSQEEILYLANDGPATLFVPLDSPANLYDDNIIDFKDFAKFALEWLDICQ